MIKIFVLFCLISMCSAENTHNYESMKFKLTDGLSKIMDQLTDTDHLMDDYEDDGFDFNELDKETKESVSMELQYFRLHDYDKNGKLDGNELLKSMIHEHGDHSSDSNNYVSERITSSEGVVDLMLKERDLNQDGFLSYAEFKYSNV